ncbi:serine hydrolase domain-containing protein [Azospirillum sp. sgz302134]
MDTLRIFVRRFLPILLMVLAFLTAPPPARAAADLRAVLDDVLRRYDIPGGVLLLSTPDRREVVAAGIADLRSGRPMTAETRLHIASTGKMLTAVAVLRLIQDGLFGLADPALPLVDHPDAARLPNLKGATVADLLSHRSGIPDCLRNSRATTDEHPDPHWTADDVLRLMPCRQPTKRGEYAYSNTNYILLGHILEHVDRRPFAEALAERVLRPAGMQDTTVGANPEDPGVARGYRRPDAKGKRADASLFGYSSPLGDAPVTTTAADLERFAQALFRTPGALLNPVLLREMLIDRAGEAEEGYGYGLVVEHSDWGPRWGHGGRLAGFRSEFWYYPDRDALTVLLLNGDENTEDDVGALIARRLFAPSAR